MDQKYLTARELAARWHRTTGALANDRCKGIGPEYLKIGSRVLYAVATVEAHEAAALVKPLDARTAA